VGTISQRSRKDPAYGSDWITKYYVSGSEDYKTLQYVVEHTVFRRNEEGLSARIRDLGRTAWCSGGLTAALSRSS